jgi:hypothetical protein
MVFALTDGEIFSGQTCRHLTWRFKDEFELELSKHAPSRYSQPFCHCCIVKYCTARDAPEGNISARCILDK